MPPLGGPKKVELAKEPIHNAATVALRRRLRHTRHEAYRAGEGAHRCAREIGASARRIGTCAASQQSMPCLAGSQGVSSDSGVEHNKLESPESASPVATFVIDQPSTALAAFITKTSPATSK